MVKEFEGPLDTTLPLTSPTARQQYLWHFSPRILHALYAIIGMVALMPVVVLLEPHNPMPALCILGAIIVATALYPAVTIYRIRKGVYPANAEEALEAIQDALRTP